MSIHNPIDISYMLERVIEHSSDFFGVATPSGQAVFVNSAGKELLGIDRNQDLSTTKMHDYIMPEDHLLFEEQLIKPALAQGRSSSTIRMRHFGSNEPILVDMNFFYLPDKATNGVMYFMAFAKDLRAAVLSEQLRGLSKAVQSQAKIGGWELDIESGKTIWTDQVYEIYGLPTDTPTDKIQGISFYAEKDRPRLAGYVEDCIRNGKSFDDIFEFVDAKCVHKWVRATGTAIRDQYGKVLKVFGTFRDISSERERSDELIRQQSQLKRVIANAPGMVYQFKLTKDGKALFPFVSSQSFEIYEITETEFRENPAIFLERVHPDDAEEITRSIEASAQQMTKWEWSGRIVTKTGKVKYVKAKSIPQPEPDGGILWDGLLWDVTAEHETEVELSKQKAISIHSAKLASIGELAASVGHEINNPLAIVVGFVNKLRKDLEDSGYNMQSAQSAFDKISQAAHRISLIVNSLRTFSRIDDQKIRVFDLRHTVDEVLSLIGDIYRHEGITIDWQRPMDEILVQGIESRLEQVIMNLMTNAKDALVQSPVKQITIRILKTKEAAAITVQDSGSGISDDIKSRIFDAFFTTKASGAGTGLGLALSKSIVAEHEGELSFESSSAGTIFKIQLPLSQVSAKQMDKDQHNLTVSVENSVAIGRRILVVDDEPDLRFILAETLKDLGCTVAEAPDGAAALEILKSNSFDAIFTDLRMPKIGGVEFAKAVHALLGERPKIVLITGAVPTAANQSSYQAIRSLTDKVLEKPFTQSDILKLLTSLWPE